MIIKYLTKNAVSLSKQNFENLLSYYLLCQTYLKSTENTEEIYEQLYAAIRRKLEPKLNGSDISQAEAIQKLQERYGDRMYMKGLQDM